MNEFMGEQVVGPYIATMQNLLVSMMFTIAVSGFMLVIYTVLLALIQNNPLLSLGVLGSLSICRIRTNTKDPRDLGFVFWALAIGIASAVGRLRQDS